MRAWFLALGLVAVALAQPAGLSSTECFVVRNQYTDEPRMADLRGNLHLRNDSGQVWKNARIVVHLMDGYGSPIFNYQLPPVRSWAPREVKDASFWEPGYRGSVFVFKLGAEVDATADGQPVHFEMPPTEANPSTPLNY
ncbi:hypothetical protein JST97_24735 [bacterium]|nr:hypothetical protein [bacterium]